MTKFSRTRTRTPKAFTGLLASIYSILATAQDGSPPPRPVPTAPTPATSVQRVEITGSQDLDERRAASTLKTIVTNADIVRYGDSSVTDILRRVPGIAVSGSPGRGGEIRMQGLGSGYTQILVNGEPMAPGFSVDGLSPSVIERIEILRSPTADMSTQAIAGTINIILKQKVRPGQRELKVGAGGYEGNPSYYLDGQSSDRSGNLSYTLAGGLSRENNTWPSVIEQSGQDAAGNPNLHRSTAKTEYARDDTLNLSPRINWKLEGDDELSTEMLARFRRTEAGAIDRRTTVFGTPPLYAANDLKLNIDSTSLRTKLNWLHKLSNDAKLDVKGGLQYAQRDSVAKFLGFDEAGRIVLDDDTTSAASDTSMTLGGKYRASYLDNHAAALGWDSEYSRRVEDRIQRQRAPAGYPAVDLDESYDARVERLALYAQDEWDVTKSLSAYLGLRWEGLETRSAGNVLTEVKNRSNVLSPLMQTVWKLPDSNNDQIRLGLGRTYKAPNTRELMPRRYVANDNTATTPDLQGSPDLRPELAWGLDIAYEHYVGKAGLVSFGANARRIEDVILQQLSYVNGKWMQSPVNSGNASTRGVQIETRLALAKLNDMFADMDIRASATKNWSSVESVPAPNNRLDKQVPFVATVGLDYRARTYPITVGGNFSFQQGAPVALSANQTASIGVKRGLDLYGLWKLSPQTQVRFVAQNALRQDYIAEANYFDGSGRLDQTTTAPTNMAVKATLEMKL